LFLLIPGLFKNYYFGIFYLTLLFVSACSEPKSDTIHLKREYCLNLMPGEKELKPISLRASDAFMNCCQTDSSQLLHRVFTAQAHNIFISFGSPDKPVTDSIEPKDNSFQLLEERNIQSDKMREYLYKSGRDWIYRIQLSQANQVDWLILDFVGRDSLLMKNIFVTPRFAQLRTQCAQHISPPSKKIITDLCSLD